VLSRYASAIGLALLYCAALLFGWLSMRVGKLIAFLLVLRLVGLGPVPLPGVLVWVAVLAGALAVVVHLIHRRLAGIEHRDDAWLD
jgi:hypothetical protein